MAAFAMEMVGFFLSLCERVESKQQFFPVSFKKRNKNFRVLPHRGQNACHFSFSYPPPTCARFSRRLLGRTLLTAKLLSSHPHLWEGERTKTTPSLGVLEDLKESLKAAQTGFMLFSAAGKRLFPKHLQHWVSEHYKRTNFSECSTRRKPSSSKYVGMNMK